MLYHELMVGMFDTAGGHMGPPLHGVMEAESQIMSDIKLFRTNGETVTELEGRSVTLEKSLQTLVEPRMSSAGQSLRLSRITGFPKATRNVC